MSAALYKHVGQVQDRAGLLLGVLEAAIHLDRAEECRNGRDCLFTLAEQMSREIFEHLDIVALPDPEDAA